MPVPVIVPKAAVAYVSATATKVEIKDGVNVEITVQKSGDRAIPITATFLVEWHEEDQSPYTLYGGRFDSAKIWVGGCSTLKRQNVGPVPPGDSLVLINTSYITEPGSPFPDPAKWLEGIKWPGSAGDG